MRRFLWRVAFAAAVAALGVGGFAVYRSLTRTSGPADVARAYYAALARGDAPAALALGDVPDGPHDLLTAAVLREQLRIAPVEDVTVAATARSANNAKVTVRYAVVFPGRSIGRTDVVGVHESDGHWRLDRTAAATTLHLDRAAQRASILGTTVPTTRVLLFPGAVPVRFDSSYLQFDPDRAVLGLDAPDTTTLPVQVSAAGRRQVQASVATALRGCLAAGAAGSCPVPGTRYVPGTVRGTVRGTPTFAITVDAAATGVLDIVGDVSVDASYRKLTFKNQPEAGRGTITLPVHARAYARAPLSVVWSRS